jgi:hypothetical protein
MAKRSSPKPITRSVINIQADKAAKLTLFRSHNERTLVFDFNGQRKDMGMAVAAIAKKYGKLVSGIVPHEQTQRFAVTFKKTADLAAIEKDGFTYDESAIPIHRTYLQKTNLLLVTLLNTPVTSEEDLSSFLKSELAQYGSVQDIRLCFWPNTPGYLMPRAIALFNIDKESDTPDRLPSTIICPDSGAEISLRWKGAPPSCRYCKKVGHLIKDCRHKGKWSKRMRLSKESEAPSSSIPTSHTASGMEVSKQTSGPTVPQESPVLEQLTTSKLIDSHTIPVIALDEPISEVQDTDMVSVTTEANIPGEGDPGRKQKGMVTRKRRAESIASGVSRSTEPYHSVRIAKQKASKNSSRGLVKSLSATGKNINLEPMVLADGDQLVSVSQDPQTTQAQPPQDWAEQMEENEEEEPKDRD